MPVNRFSQIFTPSEYTAPIDLASYASLINRRQQLFDVNQSAAENKLQAMIDLPVSRDVDRQYINELVGKTTEAINNIGNKDYSDPMVMREINNQIGVISYDPVINSALSSTQMMNADNKEIEFFKKKGTGYSDANAAIIQKAQAEYLNNPDINAKYNKIGYTPHAPYDKDLQDKLKNIKGLEYITSTTIDPNDPSKQYQEQIKISEITPDRIVSILSQTMTPEQRNQIRIDAEYQYRGAGDSEYVQWQIEHQDLELQQIDKSIMDIDNARTASLRTGNVDTKSFDEQEAKLKKEKELLQNEMKNPDAILLKARNNSNALKTWQFYKQYSQGLGALFQTKTIDINSKVIGLENGTGSKSTGSGTVKGIEGVKQTLLYITPPDVNGDLTGNTTKSYFINDLASINNEKIASRNNTWTDLVRTGNPAYLNKTPAEQEALFANWQKLFYEGKLIPTQVENHFVSMAKLNSRAQVTQSIIDKGEMELQKDPEYKKMTMGLAASQKLLPKQSDIYFTVEKDYKNTGLKAWDKTNKEHKKTYSQEAILNFHQALLESGQSINDNWLDFRIPLGSRSGDNSLIDDINKANADVLINYDNSKTKNWTGTGLYNATVGGIAEFLFPTSGFRDFGVSNPLNFLSYPGSVDTSFIKHFNDFGLVAEQVNKKEAEIYKKNGYANLVPTVVVADTDDKQKEIIPMVSQLRKYFAKGEGDESTITSVRGFTGLSNGNILIEYDVKEGDKTKSKSMPVPRTSLGSLNNIIPSDPDEGYEEMIRAAGGTSTDIQYAPVIQTGAGPLHYRIYPLTSGNLKLQFFVPGGKDLDQTERGIPEFSSVYDMNLFLSHFAMNYTNVQKNANPNK